MENDPKKINKINVSELWTACDNFCDTLDGAIKAPDQMEAFEEAKLIDIRDLQSVLDATLNKIESLQKMILTAYGMEDEEEPAILPFTDGEEEVYHKFFAHNANEVIEFSRTNALCPHCVMLRMANDLKTKAEMLRNS